MRIFLSSWLIVFSVMSFNCSKNSGTGPIETSIQPGAVKLAAIFDTTTDIFNSPIDTTFLIDQVKVVIEKGVTMMQTPPESLIRKVEVYLREEKVYQDSSASNWQGITVFQSQINNQNAILIIGGIPQGISVFFTKAVLILDGKIINLLPNELEYPIHNFEDATWTGWSGWPNGYCFHAKQITPGEMVYRICLGGYHSGRDNSTYWFSVNLSSGTITQYGSSD